MIHINFLIGTTIIQRLTEAICQTKEKTMILEITIRDMLVITLIYKIILLLMDYNWHMKDIMITKGQISVNLSTLPRLINMVP